VESCGVERFVFALYAIREFAATGDIAQHAFESSTGGENTKLVEPDGEQVPPEHEISLEVVWQLKISEEAFVIFLKLVIPLKQLERCGEEIVYLPNDPGRLGVTIPMCQEVVRVQEVVGPIAKCESLVIDQELFSVIHNVFRQRMRTLRGGRIRWMVMQF